MAWALLGLLVVAVVAAIAEALLRRRTKRPLSRHAVHRRPENKPPLGMEATDIALMTQAMKRNARLADKYDGKWPWQ
ncbi:hypothetical protein PEL8287_00629 [Roseovarius litorisediminis]|uniref:Uncharacterized protein n=1 Tax=Roseovarius litorisediminis TaxID=1312363 RepID=A0A1Y5RDU0_9RHOB|nr:hypothetical protein [Roseovarius litorisediminis]SLN15113.1 hypothetical protein PEL8287_00629 [Roseovarius litorisediminis]